MSSREEIKAASERQAALAGIPFPVGQRSAIEHRTAA
jgi:hypothetical protein